MNRNAIFASRRVLGRAGFAALALFAFGHESLAAPNPPLQNSGFEIVGPNGPATLNTTVAPGGAGNSAAAGWGIFHNTVPPSGAVSETALLPTTDDHDDGCLGVSPGA